MKSLEGQPANRNIRLAKVRMLEEPDWTRTDPQIAACAQDAPWWRKKGFLWEKFDAVVRNAKRALPTPFDEEKVSLPGQKYRTWPKTNDRNGFLGYVNIYTAKESFDIGQSRG